MQLDKNHKRRLLIGFEHIDKLLSDAEQILSSARSSCLFKQYIADAGDDVQEALEHGIAEFRALMAQTLKELNIPPQPPTVGALHAVQTLFTFVDIAIEEMTAKYMRGYGDLPRGTPEELDAVVSRIQEAFKKMCRMVSDP